MADDTTNAQQSSTALPVKQSTSQPSSDVQEEMMPQMTESYSEILGKPLQMKIPDYFPQNTSRQLVENTTTGKPESVCNESIDSDNVNVDSKTENDNSDNSPQVSPNKIHKQTKPTSLPCLSTVTEGRYIQYYSNTSFDEEVEGEAKTPVYEDIDPAQAILSRHRLAAYLASPDYSEEESHDLGRERLNFDSSAAALPVGKCGPELAEAALRSAGTVTRLPNNTVSFVADDLLQKIKLTSPTSLGSGASTPKFSYPYQQYYSGGSNASAPLSLPRRPPPLDPTLLNDIERHARRLATNVDSLIESLTDALHGISALTVDCVETYRDTVCKTCDSVDANIKSMYQLMAKGEELSKSMKPVYGLHAQIKDVRRTLDILDAEINSHGS